MRDVALPRALHLILLALAWLAAPLTALAVASAWYLPDRGVIISTAGAAMAWTALVILYTESCTDARLTALREREQVLARALDQLAGPSTPQRPGLRPVPPARGGGEARRASRP